MSQKEAVDKFTKWYVLAIEKLKEMPGGNGGFAAFIIGLALYERLIVARLKAKGIKSSPHNRTKEVSSDLGLNDEETGIFWDVFRNGFLHQAMPKPNQKDKISYALHHNFDGIPKFKDYQDQKVVCINPWKFVDTVINSFLEHPELINSSLSYPFPVITQLPPELFE